MKNKYPGEMIDPRILEEQAKQSQLLDKKLLHPTGKTNYAMQIFTEALVKKIERDEDIYTAQVINAHTSERGPFDFSLEAELANIVDEEHTLEIKTCPPFVPEVVNDNNRYYVGKGMTRDDFFKKDHKHPLLTEEQLHTPITVNPEDVRQLTETIDELDVDKPVKVAILGAPRLQAEYLIATMKDAGIEVTQRIDHDESDLIGNLDMKMLSTAALGLKHLNASPYQGSRRPREETELNTNRKLVRKAQSSLNKKQGFGKRLTKKDKLETQTKSNYVETYMLERTDTIEIDRNTGKTKVINNE